MKDIMELSTAETSMVILYNKYSEKKKCEKTNNVNNIINIGYELQVI